MKICIDPGHGGTDPGAIGKANDFHIVGEVKVNDTRTAALFFPKEH